MNVLETLVRSFDATTKANLDFQNLENCVQDMLREHPEGWSSNWAHLCGIWTSAKIPEKNNALNALAFRELRDAVREACSRYLRDLGWSCVDFDVGASWVEVVRPGQFKEFHKTPSASNKICGMVFLRTCEHSGAVEFKSPIDDVLSLWHPGARRAAEILPKPGTIVLHPSWMEHSLQANRSVNDVVLAVFDVHVVPPKSVDPGVIAPKPKYVHVPDFLSKNEIHYLSHISVQNLVENNPSLNFGDHTVQNAYQISNAPILNYLLFSKLKEVRGIFGKPDIIPYYSYCRYYTNGTRLKRHTDNDALQYTLSINVFQTDPYDIQISDPDTGRDLAFALRPGDALAIEGNKVMHWRDAYDGCLCVQVFLHYMDSNSPHAHKAIRLRDHGREDVEEALRTRLYSPHMHSKINHQIIPDKHVSYDVELFPALAKALADSTLLDAFVAEAAAVYEKVPVNSAVSRKRDEWDHKASAQGFIDKIRAADNSFWTIAQNNPDWLNFPLVYYDSPMGGKADELCPNMMRFLKELKHVRIAGLSLIKKGGKLDLHSDSTGRTSDALACHVCLIGRGLLTVRDQQLIQEPKKILIFDAEYPHALVNAGDCDRIVLYIDFVYSKHVDPVKMYAPRKARILYRTKYSD